MCECEMWEFVSQRASRQGTKYGTGMSPVVVYFLARPGLGILCADSVAAGCSLSCEAPWNVGVRGIWCCRIVGCSDVDEASTAIGK